MLLPTVKKQLTSPQLLRGYNGDDLEQKVTVPAAQRKRSVFSERDISEGKKLSDSGGKEGGFSKHLSAEAKKRSNRT